MISLVRSSPSSRSDFSSKLNEYPFPSNVHSENGLSSPSEPAVICSAPDPALGWRNDLSLRSCYGGFFHVGFYRPGFCGPRGACLNCRKCSLSGSHVIVHSVHSWLNPSLFSIEAALESIRLPRNRACVITLSIRDTIFSVWTDSSVWTCK